jgi:hypothetical protein
MIVAKMIMLYRCSVRIIELSPWPRLLLLLLRRPWHQLLLPWPLRLRAAFALVAPASFVAATSAAV